MLCLNLYTTADSRRIFGLMNTIKSPGVLVFCLGYGGDSVVIDSSLFAAAYFVYMVFVLQFYFVV